MIRKTLIVAEVAVILVLFFYLRQVFRLSGFGGWQETVFGRAILSSSLLFFVLPLSSWVVTSRGPGVYGLAGSNFSRHAQLALQAIAVVMPVTILFPVIAALGTDHRHWLGGSILAIGFAAGGIVIVRRTRRAPTMAEARLSFHGFLGYVGLLAVGFGLCYLLQPLSELITRVIIALIFVGFLEEFFFRGYVQTRLNEAFARPYSLFSVNYGAGLMLAALIFGLFHPLTVSGENPWAWSLWTATGGLIFGFLREKSGAVVTPALVHGAMLVPGVLFGSVGS